MCANSSHKTQKYILPIICCYISLVMTLVGESVTIKHPIVRGMWVVLPGMETSTVKQHLYAHEIILNA